MSQNDIIDENDCLIVEEEGKNISVLENVENRDCEIEEISTNKKDTITTISDRIKHISDYTNSGSPRGGSVLEQRG